MTDLTPIPYNPHEQSIEEWIARLESIKSSVLNASPAHDDAYEVTYYVSAELWGTFPGEIDNAITWLKEVERSVLRSFYDEVCSRAETCRAPRVMTSQCSGPIRLISSMPLSRSFTWIIQPLFARAFSMYSRRLNAGN